MPGQLHLLTPEIQRNGRPVGNRYGCGCALKWLPALHPDRLYFVRGGANNTIAYYDLVINTSASVAYKPDTETFTTVLVLQQDQ